MAPSTDAPVQASDFGARGDGTTDDAAALRAALAAAGTGTLRLAAGATYAVGSTLKIDGTTVDGAGATLTPVPGIAAPTVFSFGARGGTVRDLAVDLARARTTRPAGGPGVGAAFWTASGGWGPITLERVAVRDGHGYGIGFANWNSFAGAEAVPSQPVVLREVTVSGCRYGVNLTKVGGALLDRVRVTGCEGTGFSIDTCRDTHLTACASNGSAAGAGYFTAYSLGTVFDGCEATGNGSHGLAMGGGSTTLPPSRSFTITAGRFNGNGDCGITVDLTRAGVENRYVVVRADGGITGNEIRDNGRAGIQVEFSAYLTVTGNTSAGNGRHSAAVGSGLRVTGGNVLVDANTFTDNAAYGLALYWDPAHTGVGYHRIGTNTCARNAQGDMYTPPGTGTDPAVLPGTVFGPIPATGGA